MGVLRYVCPYFCFFRALFDEISKVSILGEQIFDDHTVWIQINKFLQFTKRIRQGTND